MTDERDGSFPEFEFLNCGLLRAVERLPSATWDQTPGQDATHVTCATHRRATAELSRVRVAPRMNSAMSHTPFSVIIPAHDEAASITTCLTRLIGDAEPGEIEVVVVCNGCRDNTAQRARSAGAGALADVVVVELAQASKAAALAAGDELATRYPRLYLDADVVLDTDGARHLVRSLDVDATRFAVGRPERIFAGCSWPVRAFYRAWISLPASQGWESGVYGVSQGAADRLTTAAPLIADDLAAARSFNADESLVVDEAVTSVKVPRHTRDLVNVRTRVRLGNAQLASHIHGGGGARQATRSASPGRDLMRLVAAHPTRASDALVYLAINLVAELRARRRLRSGEFEWLRDESSRLGPTP